MTGADALAALLRTMIEGFAPRMDDFRLAFLAHIAAIRLLTVKGMVESVGDPLIYSDEQLIADLSKIFASASARGFARARGLRDCSP